MGQEEKQIKLTSAEITQLWVGYMNDSALSCKLEFFLAKVKDKEIRPLIQQALDLAQGNMKSLTEIFNKENYPIPYGFKMEEDVDISAPILFSDTYILHYLHHGAQIALQGYSISLTLAVRADVYSYFSECISQLDEFLRETKELLLSKGLYIRSPYLPEPDNIDFVKSQSFLTGYLGERRPLAGIEITNLFSNFQRNAIGIATMMGFSQVAKSKEVRKFLARGKEISSKHCEVFGSIMKEDDLPIPMTLDTEVTDSTTYTFSDKLMMFYSTSLIALSVGFYGSSMAMSPRRDLGVKYSRLIAEILKYAEDGANIMIKNGWMEEPPRALDRDELAKKK
ncbi:DUF3231 family protein [Halobacillus shinanisalinarum]|uniref:DUF3231 family protein n=1 Tax=Halobacillus shinanisalinarum TaxID=2932258 RepID=A0ABY4H508_9BACI|nr:DUF3231 family protein [Halobacillus shinanisalinarum]UOQ95545.1 DUF3231 family protein [Halobacillus shinanisalinarum]